jgi:cell division protein FtsA
MPPPARRPDPATLLIDVGTTTCACVLLDTQGRMTGGAHAPMSGMKAGEITDPAAAAIITRTVAEAIGQARGGVAEVLLAVGAGRLTGRVLSAALPLDPPIVSTREIERLSRALDGASESDGLQMLHREAQPWRLDGVACEAPPLDRFGRTLEVIETHVAADPRALDPVVAAIRRAEAPVTRLIPAPLAAALAVTTPEERAEGVTVVDMGAGLTTYAMFADGRLAGAGSLAMGGQQLTAAIADAFHLPLTEAERIKTNCDIDRVAHTAGAPQNALPPAGVTVTERSQFAERVLRIDDTARALLHTVIHHRIGVWLPLLADRIDAEPFALAGGRRIVLTGGASAQWGLPAEAERILGRPVIARGVTDPVVPAALHGPRWAVVAGLQAAAARPGLGVRIAWQGEAEAQRRLSA